MPALYVYLTRLYFGFHPLWWFLSSGSCPIFLSRGKGVGSSRDELKLYLESGPEPTDDIIGWWGRQTESRYPTMRRIARDYLAIQGSSTPSERAFSNGRITATARRNSLSADIFEALQILKSAYRNQHVAAVYQAAEHVDALIAALDEVDHSSDGEEKLLLLCPQSQIRPTLSSTSMIP